MKTILIILDGASEEKIEELNNKTPIEYAYTPVLNEIIKHGSYQKTKFYPSDRSPDSLNCILSILGVDRSLIPKNRAYLEAQAAGIKVDESEVALRCNLVSVKDGRLNSFNGMGLTNEEMKAFSLNVKSEFKFHHISGYRNILTINKCNINSKLMDMPPHENVGMKVDELLENIKKINLLYEFVKGNEFSVNDTEYMFYPWGISEKVKLPSFQELHNKSCSCICHAEIVKGIARTMNIDVPSLKNSTGDVDTDLKEKAYMVLSELKSHDVVIAHINGTDEVSHRKDLYGKIKFIEKIDREFLNLIYCEIKNDSKIKIMILADHQTSSISGKHEKGLVDVILNQKNNLSY